MKNEGYGEEIGRNHGQSVQAKNPARGRNLRLHPGPAQEEAAGLGGVFVHQFRPGGRTASAVAKRTHEPLHLGAVPKDPQQEDCRAAGQNHQAESEHQGHRGQALGVCGDFQDQGSENFLPGQDSGQRPGAVAH